VSSVWREQWEDPAHTLHKIKTELAQRGTVVASGGDYDHWDLEIRGGLFGGARLRLAVEEHGEGKQFVRFRISPKWGARSLQLVGAFGLLAVLAAGDKVWLAATVLGAVALSVTLRTLYEVAVSVAAFGPFAAPLGQGQNQ